MHARRAATMPGPGRSACANSSNRAICGRDEACASGAACGILRTAPTSSFILQASKLSMKTLFLV
eukprot:scaffold1084_cov114-Isochrysis_galbana.AAC.3